MIARRCALAAMILITSPFVIRAADTLPTVEATVISFHDAPMTKLMHKIAMKHRTSAGLAEQQLDPECCRIAQEWANYMAREGAFHHGGGENIIATGYSTPEQAFNGWMNSGGHRAWVMGGNTLAGWGCQVSNGGQWYWSGCFRGFDQQQQVTYYNNGGGGNQRGRFRILPRNR